MRNTTTSETLSLVKARLLRTRLSHLPLGAPFQVRADMTAELSILDATADALYASCPVCQ
jgi:hypothetical protein